MLTMDEITDLRNKYNDSLRAFKASIYRCEWLKRKMLACESPQTQDIYCNKLLLQEDDAAHKFALLTEYDYQLEQLHMSTFLRDFEEICRYEYIQSDRR